MGQRIFLLIMAMAHMTAKPTRDMMKKMKTTSKNPWKYGEIYCPPDWCASMRGS